MTKKSQMPLFIQVMYGTVLGVGTYKITFLNTDSSKSNQNLDKSLDFFSSFSFSEFIVSEYFFRFLLFASMLLIIAHDWFSYHRQKKPDEETNFWYHVPQLFSLFFLAQMFVAIEALNLKYWYVAAFFYTIFNIINIWIIYNCNKNYIIRYAIHIALTVVGFFGVKEDFESPRNQIVFVLIFLVVVLLWHYEQKRNNKNTESEDGDAIKKAENIARKVRERLFTDIKSTIADEKIGEVERNILIAEQTAKEEREKLSKRLEKANKEILQLKDQLNEKNKSQSR